MSSSVLEADRRTQPAVLAFAGSVLAALLAAWAALSPAGLDSADWQGFLAASLPIAITAMAQTLPIIAGGQGLSAGGTVIAAAAVAAQMPLSATWGAWPGVAAGLGVGLLIGGCNGALTGFGRMRSTPVTLATGALAAACALQWASGTEAAGQPELASLVLGARAGGIAIVLPLVLLALAALFTAALATRHGAALRQVGVGMTHPARPWLLLAAYAAAGSGSAVGGILLAASYGSVNLAQGAPVQLQVLAAAALGGSIPGLRGGSPLGALLGGLIVVASGNVFVALEWPEFLSNGVDAAWLLLGFLVCRLAQRGPGFTGWGGTSAHGTPSRFGRMAALAAPLVLLAANLWPNSADLATMLAGLALLAAGQTASLRGGTIDLSMPGLIVAAAIGTVAWTGGQNAALPWTLGGMVVAALALGLLHGAAAARWHRAAMAITLATSGIAQAAAAGFLVLLPTGYAPPSLTALANLRWLGVSPAAWLLSAMAAAMALGMDRAGQVCGPRSITLLGSAASALSAAVFGIMLAGLGGSVHFSLLDLYFLPTIAAALLAHCRPDRPWASVSRAIPLALALGALDLLLVINGAGYAARIGAVSAVLVAGEALHAAAEQRARA